MSRTRFTISLISFLAATSLAASQTKTESFKQTLRLDFDGSITVESPIGSITIIGTESRDAVVSGVRTVTGIDAEAVAEGETQTKVQYAGHDKNRLIRTLTPFPPRSRRWESSVDYQIRVPRTVHVTVFNHSSEALRISNISGNVSIIRHVNGTIDLTAVTGATTIDTANGNVRLHYLVPPQSNVNASSINGQIEIIVPEESGLEWMAHTLKGEFFSSLPFRGRPQPQLVGRVYRGALNNASNPQFVTHTLTGKVFLLGTGDSRSAARPLRPAERPAALAVSPQPVAPRGTIERIIKQFGIDPPNATNFFVAQQRIDGNFSFETSLGNILVGEMNGDARVLTRAGEIVLGRVAGSCYTRSGGGSLSLGDISGLLTAETSVGDVKVRAAHKGGTITTESGDIQVLYAGGRLNLFSGGGNINVRQAVAPVKAESRSGDITINIDPSAGSQPVEAKSVGGNIILNLSPGFGADIEAVALVRLGQPNPIQSEFAGLQISSERVGDQIRTRATGRINGGGQRVSLTVEGGTIHLRSRVLPLPPIQ